MAGPSGVRLPCSQLRSVATLTPIISANSACDALSFSRTLFTSAERNVVTRAGLSLPRRIFLRAAPIVRCARENLNNHSLSPRFRLLIFLSFCLIL